MSDGDLLHQPEWNPSEKFHVEQWPEGKSTTVTSNDVNGNYCWNEIFYITRVYVRASARTGEVSRGTSKRRKTARRVVATTVGKRLRREYNASKQRFNSNTPRRFVVLLCYSVKLMKNRQRRVYTRISFNIYACTRIIHSVATNVNQHAVLTEQTFM